MSRDGAPRAKEIGAMAGRIGAWAWPGAGARGAERVVLAADDAVLVRAAQQGDELAFADLVRRHQVRVYRVALRVAGARLAEDAAQEALVRVWRTLPRFRGESAFTTWLYRVTVNAALDAVAAEPHAVELPAEPLGPGRGADEAAQRRERLRALTAAILRLGPEQRAALVLREFEGQSYDAIAEALGTTVAGVKGRVHRARLALAADTREWR
jgi:RNA polymerase sigma-70 factor (ECF subfamily)